jgi:hypothetical protein
MEVDQVLEGYVKEMGSELGPIFHAVSNELTWVHWRWNQYRILFGEKPSLIELLNESAPFFFVSYKIHCLKKRSWESRALLALRNR